MGVEVERKFLLASDEWRAYVTSSSRLIQGYFVTGRGLTLRIRIYDDKKAVLTLKGAQKNFARAEFNYEVPLEDSKNMLAEFCGDRIVEKTRNLVPYGGFIWEIDEYFGANTGLFTAEIEIPTIDTPFEIPTWVGEDVSDNPAYSNKALSCCPYSTWNKTKGTAENE